MVLEVRRLAAVGLASGFTSFDQRQPGASDEAADLAAADLQDLGAAVRELARLVGLPGSSCARSAASVLAPAWSRSSWPWLTRDSYLLVGRVSTRIRVWEDCAMATSRVTDDGDTATRILDSAESLVQVRGFNGFSYADVAAELGVTKASLHYHFPGKAELGRALIVRYATRFNAALAGIDASGADAPDQARRLRAPLRRRAARPAHVPVRHARGRVPDPARADARRRARLLRRERGVGRARARRRAATRGRWRSPATRARRRG